MACRSFGGPGVLLNKLLGGELEVVLDTQPNFATALQDVGAVAIAGHDASLVGAAERGEVGEHGGAGGLLLVEGEQERALSVVENREGFRWCHAASDISPMRETARANSESMSPVRAGVI